MNLDVPLVHYLTGGSVLEAVAPGPRQQENNNLRCWQP